MQSIQTLLIATLLLSAAPGWAEEVKTPASAPTPATVAAPVATPAPQPLKPISDLVPPTAKPAKAAPKPRVNEEESLWKGDWPLPTVKVEGF